MSPLRPTTTSSVTPPARAGVSPLALAVCLLATLVAVPILLSSSDESRAEEVAVVAVDETVSESELEPDIDIDQLFDAGARLDDLPEVAEESSETPTSAPSTSTAETIPEAATAEAEPAIEPRVLSPIPERPTRVDPEPTTTLPPAPTTTAPPTTAPPTTPPPTMAPPTTPPPTTAPPTTAAPATEQAAADQPAVEEAATAEEIAPVEEAAPTSPTPEQWAALRHCESSGSYTVISRNGLYHGAYQFYQPTWDGLARQVGRSDLVGLPPSQASPADQDALALLLWQQRGPQPWPVCGRHLPPLP